MSQDRDAQPKTSEQASAACRESVVPVGGLEITDDPAVVLVTYSLGSCLGVTAYDPETGVGGLLHAMLPLSRRSPRRREEQPGMFVDTGMVLLLERLCRMGARKSRLQIKVAGAGQALNAPRLFRIGERNYAVLRRVLWKNGIMIAGEVVGGERPRTMRLYLADGRSTVATAGHVEEL